MSEEFDVAIAMPSTDAGVEAKPVTHRHGASSAPTGDNPQTPPPDSTTALRDQRVISDSTRKAIAKIAAAGKRADSVDLGDELVPMGTEPEKPVVTAPKTAVAAAAAKIAESTAQVDTPAAELAPNAARELEATAAEIMARAETDKLRGEHDQRVKALEARESALAEREKLLPDRTMFAERPGAALAAMLRHTLGLGEKDDAELKEAISDLVTEASMEHLGVTLPDEVKNKLEARKALRSTKALRYDIDRQKADMAAQRDAQAKADKEAGEQRIASEREREAIKMVYQLVDGTKESHPFLHAAGELGIVQDPSAMVVAVIRQQRARGENANWQAATKIVDDHYRPKVEAALKKSAGLSTKLNPAAPAGSSAVAATAIAATPASQQGGEPVRRPTTLTTTPTAATIDPATDDGAETEDRFDRRHRSLRATFARHKARFNVAES